MPPAATAIQADASIVLGLPGYGEPATRLATRIGAAYADVDVHRFPDGESRVRLPAGLPRDVLIYGSFDDPNRQLIELELAAATAARLGGQRLTLVAPYLCYMRQDAAFRPGEAVSQQIVGALLARRFDRLVTVDPHLHRTPTLAAAVPVRRAVALTAAPLMAEWLAQRDDQPLLIGPDEESAQWVSAIAEPARLEYGVARKTRLGDSDVRIELPEQSFRGRRVVLVDDVASTGHTLAEATRRITAAGAASVAVLVTHALFVGDALERLRRAGVTDICSTDSILHETNRLQLAGLLADALLGAS